MGPVIPSAFAATALGNYGCGGGSSAHVNFIALAQIMSAATRAQQDHAAAAAVRGDASTENSIEARVVRPPSSIVRSTLELGWPQQQTAAAMQAAMHTTYMRQGIDPHALQEGLHYLQQASQAPVHAPWAALMANQKASLMMMQQPHAMPNLAAGLAAGLGIAQQPDNGDFNEFLSHLRTLE